MTAVVLPTSQSELGRKLVTKPCGRKIVSPCTIFAAWRERLFPGKILSLANKREKIISSIIIKHKTAIGVKSVATKIGSVRGVSKSGKRDSSTRWWTGGIGP